MTSPLDVYGEDLGAAVAGSPATTWLRDDDGSRLRLDLPRWTAPAAGADVGLLARCRGPVLDLGCGPGRLTRALLDQGTECLGVDVAPAAVALARTGGVPVLQASAFDAVLDRTSWSTVLLADGNIGIGGDPVVLLRRCRSLLGADGSVLVELDAPAARTRSVGVRVESSSGRTSSRFRWAHVSARDVAAVALQAGLAPAEVWETDGRWFARLDRAEPVAGGGSHDGRP